MTSAPGSAPVTTAAAPDASRETGGRVAGQDVRLAHGAGQRPEQRTRKRHYALAMV